MPTGMDRQQFDQDVRDANYAARRTAPSLFTWIGVAILVVAVIGAVIWGVKVVTAPARGAGDTILKDQDANNRIAQQRAFVTMYEGVKADDRKLQTLADTATRTPGDPKAQADYQGTQLICQQHIAEYNAKVQETLAARWLPQNLPTELGLEPATDCQPNIVPSAATSR